MSERTVWSEEQRALILEELNQILADLTFKSSKRCQGMLVYLVNCALAGDLNGLKERTLGIQAFGRDPNYDTNSDPIVRTTATEIRKRLAQWYQPNRPHRVRIRLVPGSYLPDFDFDDPDKPKEAAVEERAAEEKGIDQAADLAISNQPTLRSEQSAQPAASGNAWRKWALWSVAILLLAACIFVPIRSHRRPSKESILWKPLLDTSKPLTLCIGDTSSLVGSGADGDTRLQVMANAIDSREAPVDAAHDSPGAQNTPFMDARVAQKMSIFFGAQGRQPVLRDASSLNFADFHRGPVVLIGAFNPWSVVLLSNPMLRYSVRVDPANHEFWIRDAQNPTSRTWNIDSNQDHHNVDYAVITRFFDNETNEWVFGLCGLWSYGTDAAVNLLVEPEFSQLLPASLDSTRNFQIVVKTSVISGNTGVPQIVAYYAW